MWDVRGRIQGRRGRGDGRETEHERPYRGGLDSGVKREDLSCSNEEPWSHVEYFSQGIMGSRWHFFFKELIFFFKEKLLSLLGGGWDWGRKIGSRKYCRQ